MKAKVTRGSKVKGLLRYAYDVGPKATGSKRVEQIGGNMIGQDIGELEQEFTIVYRLRPDIAKPVWHCSLALPKGERLDKDKWDKVVADFLKEMQFDLRLTQYVAVRHQDTKYDHVHIIVSRVRMDAKVWLGQWEARRVIEATQTLELKYDLTVTKGLEENRAAKRRPGLGELKMGERTQEETVRSRLQRFVDLAVDGNPTAVMFAARMVEQGVEVRINFSKAEEINGFSYQLDGISFQSGQLGRQYSWRGLKTRGVTYERARDYPELTKFEYRADRAVTGSGALLEGVVVGPEEAAGGSVGPSNNSAQVVEGVGNISSQAYRSTRESVPSVEENRDVRGVHAEPGISGTDAVDSRLGKSGSAAGKTSNGNCSSPGGVDKSVGSGAATDKKTNGSDHRRSEDSFTATESGHRKSEDGFTADGEIARAIDRGTETASIDEHIADPAGANQLQMDVGSRPMEVFAKIEEGSFSNGDSGIGRVSWGELFRQSAENQASAGIGAENEHLLGSEAVTIGKDDQSLKHTHASATEDTLGMSGEKYTGQMVNESPLAAENVRDNGTVLEETCEELAQTIKQPNEVQAAVELEDPDAGKVPVVSVTLTPLASQPEPPASQIFSAVNKKTLTELDKSLSSTSTQKGPGM